MLNCTSVQKNLIYCNRLFNESSDIMHKKFIIRMALLEVCGWIEEYLDTIYIQTPRNQQIEQSEILKDHIEHLYSFEYKKIMKTLSLAFGVYHVSFIEDITKQKFSYHYENFKSSINLLKKYRNNNAHSHTENCADAPELGLQSLKKHFKYIRLGLYYIECQTRKSISTFEKSHPIN